MARLAKGAENSISMAFVVMCTEKIRRLLRLFFITIFAWIYAFQRPIFLWKAFRDILWLETEELLITALPI
jgi:hypothetical protein